MTIAASDGMGARLRCFDIVRGPGGAAVDLALRNEITDAANLGGRLFGLLSFRA